MGTFHLSGCKTLCSASSCRLAQHLLSTPHSARSKRVACTLAQMHPACAMPYALLSDGCPWFIVMHDVLQQNASMQCNALEHVQPIVPCQLPTAKWLRALHMAPNANQQPLHIHVYGTCGVWFKHSFNSATASALGLADTPALAQCRPLQSFSCTLYDGG
jgi:hypothetical protein